MFTENVSLEIKEYVDFFFNYLNWLVDLSISNLPVTGLPTILLIKDLLNLFRFFLLWIGQKKKKTKDILLSLLMIKPDGRFKKSSQIKWLEFFEYKRELQRRYFRL